MEATAVVRCGWARTPLSVEYHDNEWGVPVHDDRRLFEFLILEGAQAGLSWETILRKRSAYREAFAGFDARAIAEFDEAKRAEVLANPGIVRNRGKIDAAVVNAAAFLRIVGEFDTFDAFVWQFAGAQPPGGRRRLEDVPAETRESVTMSRELKRRGFKYVGPTICYAFMQAVGIVNDHVVDCFRYGEIAATAKGSRVGREVNPSSRPSC